METGGHPGALCLTDTTGMQGIHSCYLYLTKDITISMFKSPTVTVQQTFSLFAFQIARTLNSQSADVLQQKTLRDRSDLPNRTE